MIWYNTHLINKENYSEYVRGLIEKDISETHNPDFIKKQIKDKKEEISALENMLRSQPADMEKINDILAKHAAPYKQNAPFRNEDQRHKFIKNVIMPQISKFGFKKSVEEIDSILLNFPTKENGGDNIG